MKIDSSILTNGLDRSSLARSNKSWIIDKINHENSRIIPVHNLTVLCRNTQEYKAVFLTQRDLSRYFELADSIPMIFLGLYMERMNKSEARKIKPNCPQKVR